MVGEFDIKSKADLTFRRDRFLLRSFVALHIKFGVVISTIKRSRVKHV
jgi:hypothetical protein